MSERPYLLEMLEKLWPGGPVLDGGSVQGSARPRQTFLAMPGGRSPSVLLPTERAASAAALRAFGGHGSRLAGLRSQVAGGLMASGLGTLLFRDRMSVSSGGENLSDELERILGHPVRVALRAGPPRANRKPVLAVLDPAARVRAFAKVGTTPLAERLVRTEHEALLRLADAGTGTVQAPRVLHFGVWHEMVLLVQTALPVHSSRPVGEAALVRLVRDVAHVGETTRSRWGASEHARRVRARLEESPAGAATAGLVSAVEVLAGQACEVPLGSWHGDLTPWNCASAGGSVLVWDWERFDSGVPVGFDLLHYRLQATLPRSGVPSRGEPDALVAGARLQLSALGLTPEQSAVTVAAYLIEIATRYLVDDQAGAGATVGHVERWLLPVISEAASRLDASGAGGRP